ncbi:hypothetical protein K144313037_12630 [Clostridium tetani]|uniref:DnaD domain protein n=1 Tax=Clostridium tetani TaxID=1513 RepID=A0A4Q0VDY6_CLOTA|nr:DnaD domain protein [Clostridium tetani]CDI49581.1 DnaD domain-containing protein [Clostridium tetani 12124569]AVP55220.1 DnaD domain protein [Clostridium tetani]KGI39957.1 hypothetical protein LA33_04535 [Clostridium tetani ATCC 9441]KHO39143.1 hypothetical protein OR62_07535 [Clostridium tetani]RXI38141.1 DnaD domain protein [Clostridium tetani]
MLKCNKKQEEEVKKICEVFEKNVRPITIIEYEKILNWMKQSSSDLIILAIEEVSKRNIKNTMYIDTYLKLVKDIKMERC